MRFVQLEAVLPEGDYFAGDSFSIVDAVYGPVFRCFDVFDMAGEFGFWDGLPRLQRWRQMLAPRHSNAQAARPDYPQLLVNFLVARRSALSKRFTPASMAG